MSLDKAIEHHKEKRKAYRGSKAIDATCKNHGSCKWCENNRKFKFRDKHPDIESEEMMDKYTYEPDGDRVLYDSRYCDGVPCPVDCYMCPVSELIYESEDESDK